MEELSIRCRIEEVPFISQLVRDCFVRDRELFTNFSPVFRDNYLDEYDKQALMVKELVAPAQLTGEMKKITLRIGEHYNMARSVANKVEFYAEKAGRVLNVKPSDFGFSVLRKKIGKRDDEAIIKSLRDMGKHIDNNSQALEEVGLTATYRTEIGTFTDTFEKDSLDQNRKLAERETLVTQNTGELNAMWNLISEVCDAGKIIGKAEKNRPMVKDYTLTEQLKKVRILRKQEVEDEGSAGV